MKMKKLSCISVNKENLGWPICVVGRWRILRNGGGDPSNVLVMGGMILKWGADTLLRNMFILIIQRVSLFSGMDKINAWNWATFQVISGEVFDFFFTDYLWEFTPHFNISFFSLIHFFCLRSEYVVWVTFCFMSWTLHRSSDWIDLIRVVLVNS